MRNTETGMALVVCTLAMLLLSSLGAALVLATSAETLIAGNFRTAQEGRYAAVAALERALGDLPSVPDWSLILDGRTRSGFVDGPASGVRTLADGSTLDLSQIVNLANCGRVVACTDGQMDAVTIERPWGVNNPRWRPYAHGPLTSLLPAGAISSRHYVLVMVADDQSETDGNPLVDGADEANPGSAVLVLRGESFGPGGARRGFEVTVARGFAAARILSWRDLVLP